MIKLSQIKSFYDKYYFTLTMPLQQSNMAILMKMKINIVYLHNVKVPQPINILYVSIYFMGLIYKLINFIYF